MANWTIEETRQLFRMKEEKYPVEVIANRIGRSYQAVCERWRWLHKSEEKKQARREQINASRRKTRLPLGYRAEGTTEKAPPELFEERNHRLSLSPRDLTAAFFGDPPPGYSALDQKRRGIVERPYLDHRLAQLQRKPSLAGALA